MIRSETVRRGPLTAVISEQWHLVSNLRKFGFSPSWTTWPTIHAIAVQIINVEEGSRQQGLCKKFIEELCRDERFDMVVVEGVQNPVLAAALSRWGWDFDPRTMDFHYRRAR